MQEPKEQSSIPVITSVLSFYRWIIACCLLLFCYAATFFHDSFIIKIFPRYRNVYAHACRATLFFMGIKVEIKGRQNLCFQESSIVLSNHASMLDIPIVYTVLRNGSIIWLAKDSLFSMPVLGRILKNAKAVPVERDGMKGGWSASLILYRNLKKHKATVFIFPEGTRSYPNGEMRPLKQGAFTLALHSQTAIQPITIQGASAMMPPQEGKWMQRVYPGKVHVTVHPLIRPEEFANKSAEELSSQVLKIIQPPIDPNVVQTGPRSSGDRAVVS